MGQAERGHIQLKDKYEEYSRFYYNEVQDI